MIQYNIFSDALCIINQDKNQRAFHALYPVLVLSFFSAKRKYRKEKPLGISPDPLISFSFMHIFLKCLAHFRNFGNHLIDNIITRLFASLSIRVTYSADEVFKGFFCHSLITFRAHDRFSSCGSGLGKFNADRSDL